MQPFTKVTGIAAALPAANVDTDVIMPKVFLKGIDRSGLDHGLFHDLRFDQDGNERPDFLLNRPGWRGAKFLVVGPNFGCGSSREHAVWGLMQFGIRGLIGTSYAGIFFDNCARNGLLAISLDDEQMQALLAETSGPGAVTITVDLQDQTIATPKGQTPFAIDTARREALLQGLDAIGQTLAGRDEIMAFQTRHLQAQPWLA